MNEINELKAWLNSGDVKGTWPAICESTGLGYQWLIKFAKGDIKDPSYTKIVRLNEYRSGVAA